MLDRNGAKAADKFLVSLSFLLARGFYLRRVCVRILRHLEMLDILLIRHSAHIDSHTAVGFLEYMASHHLCSDSSYDLEICLRGVL